MKREELLLAVLAAARGRAYQPVQIQKAMFLLNQNVPDLITGGDGYNFEPYDYGPFDKQVYKDAETLSGFGLVEVTPAPSGRWKRYAVSGEGLECGEALLQDLSKEHRKYIEDISKWVRSLGFNQLVKSVYDAYPEMKKNSIFAE